MNGIEIIERLQRLLAKSHGSDFIKAGSICLGLQTLELPIDSTQRLNYLTRERDLLFNIILNYQEKYQVPFAITQRNYKTY